MRSATGYKQPMIPPRRSGPALRATGLTLLLSLALGALLGCGVKKEIHQAMLLELEGVEEELARTRAENAAIEERLRLAEERLAERESTLAARNTELEALRQQNLELINIRDNQIAEIEELQAQTGRLAETKNKEIHQLKGTYDSLVSELQEEIKKGEIKITQAIDRLSVNMVEKILFDSGSATIKAEGLKVLERLGEILGKVTDRQIRVEGHTDNVRIGGRLAEKFPTNWELSVARATNVVKFLIDRAGVNPQFISPAGYSSHRPVASNETREGRAQNRRIEIVLLPRDIDRVLEELR